METTLTTDHSNSSSWIILSGREGMSVVNIFSVTNNIDIELCKEAI